MSKFWSSTPRPETSRRYHISEVIDSEMLGDEYKQPIHIVCDIDKTYIETKFETAMSMLKIAFEEAEEKIAVTGAALALMAARWSDPFEVGSEKRADVPRPLHFLSASPPQLRRVIREKLARDGLDWTTDTFKNQAYNIRMGRLKLLKQHVAYKTATILSHVARSKPGARFILIGDNAELDAFIYVGVQLYLAGNLNQAQYRDYLSSGGVDQDVMETLEPYFAQRLPEAQVSGILIRKAPGYKLIQAPPLTDLVIPFDHYFEVALHFYAWDLIAERSLWPLTRQLHNVYGFQREELLVCLRACERRFSEMGRSVHTLQECQQKLLKGPPMADWPERPQLRPGYRLEQLHMPADRILNEAHNWVQAIARRSHH